MPMGMGWASWAGPHSCFSRPLLQAASLWVLQAWAECGSALFGHFSIFPNFVIVLNIP
jgi:hypothetical protein